MAASTEPSCNYRLWKQDTILPSTLASLPPAAPENIKLQIRVRNMLQRYEQIVDDGYVMVHYSQVETLPHVATFQKEEDANVFPASTLSPLGVPENYRKEILFPAIFDFTTLMLMVPRNVNRRWLGLVVEIDIVTNQQENEEEAAAFYRALGRSLETGEYFRINALQKASVDKEEDSNSNVVTALCSEEPAARLPRLLAAKE